MEKFINYYEILGIDFEEAKKLEVETFKEVVISRAAIVNEKLDQDFNSGIIDEEEFNTRTEDVKAAVTVLLDETSRKEYDEALEKELERIKKTLRAVSGVTLVILLTQFSKINDARVFKYGALGCNGIYNSFSLGPRIILGSKKRRCLI